MIDLSGTFGEWWHRLRVRDGFAHAVVVGPRRSGKTEWFKRVADEERSTYYLDVLKLARRRTTDEVWNQLWDVLGTSNTTDDDPETTIDHLLRDRGDDVILVVDNWDLAVDARGAEVSDSCYEMLDLISRYCVSQDCSADGTARLGLVLVTSLPDVRDLGWFAKAVQRPTFERLSGLVTRSFLVERTPKLTRGDSIALLRDLGLDRDEPAVADDCGGWIGLLEEAARCASEAGRWTPEARADLVNERLPTLLNDSLLKFLDQRPEVVRLRQDPLVYLMKLLADGRRPTDLGLPESYDTPGILAPALRDALELRTFLVVDTENLLMPFLKHSRRDPDAYGGDVHGFLSRHVGGWLSGIAHDERIPPERIWLVGRDSNRINQLVGKEFTGERLFVPELAKKQEREEKKGKDSSDDTLAGVAIASRLQREPFGRILLVVEDADLPLVFNRVTGLDQFEVFCPWGASKRLLAAVDPARLHQNGLGVDRPPEDPRTSGPRRGSSGVARG